MELSIPPEDFDWLMDRAGVSCPRAIQAFRLRCVAPGLLWSAVAAAMGMTEAEAEALCGPYMPAVQEALANSERRTSDALLLALFRNSSVGRDHGPAFARNPYTGETVAVQLRGAVVTVWDLQQARRVPRGDLVGQGG